MKAARNLNYESSSPLTLDQIKNILTKSNMTKGDLADLKGYIYSSIDADTLDNEQLFEENEKMKDAIKDRLIMLAYLMDCH